MFFPTRLILPPPELKLTYLGLCLGSWLIMSTPLSAEEIDNERVRAPNSRENIIHSGTLPSAFRHQSTMPIHEKTFSFPSINSRTEEIIKGNRDRHEYRYLVLNNGLRTLLISDPVAVKSAIAMNVEAGSANDPENRPGLAHFLEHMLFLGSDRYPQPVEYMRFLEEHGGRHDAYTNAGNTNYMLDVSAAHLEEALARFSRFFIAPLFNQEAIERERHSVDAEYQLSFSDDRYRYYETLWQATTKEHPATGFMIGSMETLAGPPAQLSKELQTFFQKNYSANRMQLVIISPHSLDEMARHATHYFSAIPDHHLDVRPAWPAILSAQKLPARMEVKRNTDERNLIYYFQIPDPTPRPQEVPYRLVKEMLDHQGPNTLFNRLKAKGWITELETQLPEHDHRHALMSVNFLLTQEGAHHLDDIRNSFFEYLKLIESHAYIPWRHAENTRLAALAFNFYQPDNDMNTASELSNALSYLPANEINIVAFRGTTPSQQALSRLLALLTPESLLQLYNGPEVSPQKASPLYRVGYNWEKMEQWPIGVAIAGLQLPAPNCFIPEKLVLLPVQEGYPRRILNKTGLDVWYQGDHLHESPRVEWRLRLMNPDTHRSARNRVLMDMLGKWLQESLSPTLYAARLAHQYIEIDTNENGLMVSLSVWNEHPSQLIEDIIRTLRDAPITSAQFEQLRAAQRESIEPSSGPLLHEVLINKLQKQLLSSEPTDEQRREALEGITRKDIEHFRKRWLKTLHLQVMATGNVDEETVITTAEHIERQVRPNIPLTSIPSLTADRLPEGQHHVALKLEYGNSAALFYLQPTERDLKTRVITQLVEQLIQPYFSTILRTERQLGYVTLTEYYPIEEAPGIMMLIESSEYTSKTLYNEMQDYLNIMSEGMKSLTDTQLIEPKKALQDVWLARPDTLYGTASRYAYLLNHNNTNFDLYHQMYNMMETIDAEEVKKAWQKLIASPSLLMTYDYQAPETERTKGETL